MDSGVRLLQGLHWLGHASFRLDGPPMIYFDPWRLRGRLPKADLILITHEHYDHCSPADIARVRAAQTIVIANPSAAARLAEEERAGKDVRVLRPGDRLELAGVEIEALPAYNPNKRFHPRQAEHVGYIVTLGGERLYFAGDTDRIAEMKGIRCDVALLPVGGVYTMDVAEAALAAADIGPRVAVPMHYGAGAIGTPEDGERFRSLYTGVTLVMESA